MFNRSSYFLAAEGFLEPFKDDDDDDDNDDDNDGDYHNDSLKTKCSTGPATFWQRRGFWSPLKLTTMTKVMTITMVMMITIPCRRSVQQAQLLSGSEGVPGAL